jgi:chromosomal replication initiation ATPase DnaA
MNAKVNYMAIPGAPKNVNRDRTRHINIFIPDIVVNVGCEYFNVPLETLQGKCRKREFVMPRQIIMYLLVCYTDMTYLNIGKIFHKDHTTVIHSKDTIKDLMSVDDDIREKIEDLKKEIANSHQDSALRSWGL